jgi:hypothetical protein
MCGSCSTYGGEVRCIQGFGWNARGKETTWKTEVYRGEYPGLDGRIILRWIFRKWDVGYGLFLAGSG